MCVCVYIYIYIIISVCVCVCACVGLRFFSSVRFCLFVRRYMYIYLCPIPFIFPNAVRIFNGKINPVRLIVRRVPDCDVLYIIILYTPSPHVTPHTPAISLRSHYTRINTYSITHDARIGLFGPVVIIIIIMRKRVQIVCAYLNRGR